MTVSRKVRVRVDTDREEEAGKRGTDGTRCTKTIIEQHHNVHQFLVP